MRTFTVVLAVMVVGSLSGCRSVKSRPSSEHARQVSTNPNDPFFSISYSQTDIGRAEQRQPQPDAIDRLFPQNGPLGDIMEQNTNRPPQTVDTRPAAPSPRARAAVPRGQGQPMAPAPITRMEAPETVAITESGPHHVSLIYPSPEYGIIKLDKLMPQEVDLNVPFKYSMILTNLTNATLANVVLTETLSAGFQFKGATPVPQQTGNQLVWRMDSLGPKASEQIEISGIPSNLDTLKHSTAVTYAVAASSNIRVVQSTLELTRKVPSEALLGDPIQVEYIVKNTGSGTAQDVKVVEPLPSGMTTADGKNEVKFDVGLLRAGQSQTFTAQLKAARTGTFVNKAKVLSSSNAQAESPAMPVQIRRPVLAITRSSPERVYLGRPVTYEISVLNRGDGPANDTVLEDLLPTGVTDIQASPEADVSGARLTWTLGSIPPNTAKAVRVSYKPTATGILNGTTTAKAHCAEAATATVRTAIVGIPAIRLNVTDLEDPVEVGGTVTYVITASNEGSASDHNIRITCDLEDKVQYVSSSGPSQVSQTGHTLSFVQLRALAPSEKATWRVVGKALQSGSVRFKVTLSSDDLSRPIEETEATFLYQ